MKALRFSSFGDLAGQLHVEEVPTPVPGPAEVLVKVYAASLNPSDWKNVLGQYKKTVLPRTPGQDFSGVVVAGNKEMIGREIWATGGDVGFTRDGSHAEYVVIPKKAARAKPKNLSFIEAACVGRTYLTAYVGLIDKAQLQQGETVLVTGVSGGVGSSVAKLAKTKEARVIGVDLQAPDAETAGRLGIDLALSSQSDDIPARVKQFTQGKGVNVAFDCVGGPLFEVSLSTLAPGGRQVNIVSVGERRVSFDLVDFFIRRLSLFGLSTLSFDAIASADILDKLRPAFEQGKLTAPDVAKTCTIEEAVDAYRAGAAGAAGGKIVIVFPH
ncbi:MAG TPA: zinc-binding alcohol dehydrogenase family protein [Syntrophales bacterium]|nr:zinc-binding alcohol dehydrogenase family protein [Syntrophales bacterium]